MEGQKAFIHKRSDNSASTLLGKWKAHVVYRYVEFASTAGLKSAMPTMTLRQLGELYYVNMEYKSKENGNIGQLTKKMK